MKYDALSLMLNKHFSPTSLGNLRPENGLGCKYEIDIFCSLCMDENPLVGRIFALNVHVGLSLSRTCFSSKPPKLTCLCV
jgi:hypothetical protein